MTSDMSVKNSGFSPESVRQYAIARLSQVFKIEVSQIFDSSRFGVELKAGQASDFDMNEFDLIDNDIKDVATKDMLREMRSGTLVISTAGEYCTHMIRCSYLNPKVVSEVLSMQSGSK